MTAPISAWAHAVTPTDVAAFRARLPGLRFIHYANTYEARSTGDVAYVGEPAQVAAALEHRPWRLVICDDEQNIPGHGHLSGPYETPETHNARWRDAFELLSAEGIRYSTKGLAMLGGRFDRAYHDKLAYAPVRAVNCAPWEWPTVRREINRIGGWWSVTLLPVRANWHPWRLNTVLAFLRQELFAPFERTLSEVRDHPNVINVGIWTLREGYLSTEDTWQDWYGLYNRHNQETWQARVVRRALD